MLNEIIQAYNDNTIKVTYKDGYKVSCIKGLWDVSGENEAEVECEAMRYFVQYYEDGEYE